MQQWMIWLERTIGLSASAQHKILISALILGILWLSRRILLRVVGRRTEDVRVRYQWQKFSAYFTFFLALLLLAFVWIHRVSALATYLGLLSAGLAIALKEPLVNLAGWAFILWRRPFEVGDRVELGHHAGDVIDVRIFQFSLLEIGNWVAADQSTGRVIHIPNGVVFTEALANYSKGFQYIWNEIPVLVTFESNWQKAKEILLRIGEEHAASLSQSAQEQLRKAARKFLIFYTKLTPTVYTSVEDSGVLLTIRYLCDPRKRRGTTEAIWEEILRTFARCDDIDFAYPTRRFFDNAREGKPGRSAD